MTSATPRNESRTGSRLASRSGAASGGCALRRASGGTAAATAMLISPAMRTVPGSPTAETSTKPLTSTPAAAPRLLVK